MFAANGYSESITNKCLLKKAKPPKSQGEKEGGCEILRLPYIKGESENIEEQSETRISEQLSGRPNDKDTTDKSEDPERTVREQWSGVLHSV